MSFFKDFKEDLSQAVNELMPEDHTADASSMVDTVKESEAGQGTDSLKDLLKNLEPEAEAAPQPSSGESLAASLFDAAPMPAGEAAAPVFNEPAAAGPVFNEPAAEPAPMPVFNDTAASESAAPVFNEPLAAEPAFGESTSPGIEPVAPVFEEAAPAVNASDAAPEPAAPVFSEPSYDEPIFKSHEINKDEVLPTAPIFGQPDEPAYEEPVIQPERSNEVGVIIEGMVIKGDIKSEGSLDMKGVITGDIDIEGKLDITGSVEGNSRAAEVFADGAKIVGEIRTTGSVKIGQSSVVKGNITATSAVIAGAVKGDIDIQGPVILDSTAVIMGNIKSKSIQINNGAIIEGLCSQCYADVTPMSVFGEDAPKAGAKTAAKTAKAATK